MKVNAIRGASCGMNWIGRRTILAMLLIVALAILWNLLPQ